MSRWFRFYDDALDDEKVQLLPDSHFRAWVNLLCLASKNDGVLPPLEAIAFRLRKSLEDTSVLLDEFYARQLLDHVEVEDAPITYTPHNWKERQYKSDVSTDRVKQFRKRERNVSLTVSETPPETDNREQIQKDSEANASGADAPRDFRAELFSRGLAKLASLTGKGPDACRSFVGKCLKAASDDAVVVLGLIEDAERNRVADPSAWIAARLKATGPPAAKPLTEFQRKQAETNDVRSHLRNLASSGGSGRSAAGVLSDDHGERSEAVRDGAGSVVRLLPKQSG